MTLHDTFLGKKNQQITSVVYAVVFPGVRNYVDFPTGLPLYKTRGTYQYEHNCP